MKSVTVSPLSHLSVIPSLLQTALSGPQNAHVPGLLTHQPSVRPPLLPALHRRRRRRLPRRQFLSPALFRRRHLFPSALLRRRRVLLSALVSLPAKIIWIAWHILLHPILIEALPTTPKNSFCSTFYVVPLQVLTESAKASIMMMSAFVRLVVPTN